MIRVRLSQAHIRSRKRARRDREEDSIEAELDDLVMFEKLPTIINQDDASRLWDISTSRRRTTTLTGFLGKIGALGKLIEVSRFVVSSVLWQSDRPLALDQAIRANTGHEASDP